MIDTKWCHDNLNSGPIRFSDVKGEIKELFEARSWDNIIEEIGDIIYFTYCWIYSKTGINIPMFGAMRSVKKFVDRLFVWIDIFEKLGLRFDTKYLVNGSNHTKAEKVKLALDMAWKDQIG